MVANHQGGRHQGGITCGSKSASALSVFAESKMVRFGHGRWPGAPDRLVDKLGDADILRLKRRFGDREKSASSSR
jgi:hypothetical protein